MLSGLQSLDCQHATAKFGVPELGDLHECLLDNVASCHYRNFYNDRSVCEYKHSVARIDCILVLLCHRSRIPRRIMKNQ